MIAMKKITALLIALLSSPLALAGGAGTTAASFLKIDPAARTAALSGAAVALADDDATLINHNPAGIGGVERKQFSFTHNEWVTGIKLESLSYAHPVTEDFTIGAAVNYLHTDSVGSTDGLGADTGSSFSLNDGVATIGAANRFGEYFLLGAAVKGIRQSMDSRSAMAIAGDAGAILKFQYFSLGAAVTNFGSGIKLYEQSSPLPQTLKGGLTILPVRSLLLSGQADKAVDSNVILRGAVEYSFRGIIVPDDRYSLRAGYRNGSSENTGPGFSFGAGMRIKALGIDYSFVPMGDLGAANRISISFAFGEKRPDPTDAYSDLFRDMESSDYSRRKPVARVLEEEKESASTAADETKAADTKPPQETLRQSDAFSDADKARTRKPRRSSKPAEISNN